MGGSSSSWTTLRIYSHLAHTPTSPLSKIYAQGGFFYGDWITTSLVQLDDRGYGIIPLDEPIIATVLPGTLVSKGSYRMMLGDRQELGLGGPGMV
jgi:hypothetical protein